ncbi:DUF342 domain-containing protein [Konateibacter massiliensis]|uniref:DUF342 domain-containing protein n=1 Tax=Konateibacter massiliensis TaxID=2002841 RepID=UPI000C14F2D7|nr:FapA family protein [Konateibacter massiliensis]
MADKTYVRVSGDSMEAYLYLAVPGNESDYTKEDLLELLNANKVIYGIMEEQLEEIIRLGIYHREVLIAQGDKPVDGDEGRYSFEVSKDFVGKPEIRSDGTVDYGTVFAVQTISEGDVIAVYQPATMGTEGKTVTGKALQPKKGKELMPLKGKGFVCSEDKRTYIATTSGKIDFQNDRIVISNLLEIKEDLDYNNGRIDFRGDIIIHGNVESAVYIKAGGSVTIDGSVEDTTILAGKDIILRKGMQGAGRSALKSGGSIFAKFIEGCQVEAKKDIQADVLMNCTVSAGESIYISGKKATILGGVVKAASRIEAVVVGNEAEAPTRLSVGIDEETRQRISKIRQAFHVIDQRLEEVNKELGKMQLQKKKGETPQFAKDRENERAKELLRTKIKYISDKAEFKNELEELEERTIKAKKACIAVSKVVHPGVTIQANSAVLFVKEKQYAMEYRYEGGEVAMYDIHNYG